jgi:hypothetical protein
MKRYVHFPMDHEETSDIIFTSYKRAKFPRILALCQECQAHSNCEMRTAADGIELFISRRLTTRSTSFIVSLNSPIRSKKGTSVPFKNDWAD